MGLEFPSRTGFRVQQRGLPAGQPALGQKADHGGVVGAEGRLGDAQGSSLKVSRVCGSTVEVDVKLDAEGRIAEIAVEPKACALGQAASSILTRHAVGRSLEEIEAARDALRAMLKDGAEPPDGLFWELRHLQPVREYPPRHISTMLAFDAAVEAMQKALGVA